MSIQEGSITHLSSWVPSLSSIKDGVRTAGSSMLSLFNRYIGTPVEHYLIGDLRTFSSFPEEELQSGFAIRSFGLLGSAAQWQPKSKEEMTTALRTLDSEPNGRACYRTSELLINTSAQSLLSNTTASAIADRKKILGF